jgi:hypothetical protein
LNEASQKNFFFRHGASFQMCKIMFHSSYQNVRKTMPLNF